MEAVNSFLRIVIGTLILGTVVFTIWDLSFNWEHHYVKVLREPEYGSDAFIFDAEGKINLDGGNEKLRKEVDAHNKRTYEHIATEDFPNYMFALNLIIILLILEKTVSRD